MPNFTGLNGIPSRTNTSFVDVVEFERDDPDTIERGWQTADYNANLRGISERDDKETPTA